MHLRQLERILTVVERTLRQQFPSDFFKRCAYSAFGIRALMKDAGVHAELVGGDFVAFTMSPHGERAAMQGFGLGDDQCSHFWVEADQRLIDISPCFLPQDSSYPIVPMPAVAWSFSHSLPRYLRYRSRERFHENSVMSADPLINARCDEFLERCRDQMRAQVISLDFPTWVVTGPSSLIIAANKKDRWAQGAQRFEMLTGFEGLPF